LEKLDRIEVRKLPCVIEEVVDIVVKLMGLAIVYLIFTIIGEHVIGDDYSKDLLLSMVVLPAIYVLKQTSEILQPYFVKVDLKEDVLSVKQGIITTFEDSLILDTVENVETVTTLLGKLMGYSTIRISAYGSWVIVPNVHNPKELKARLDVIIQSKKAKKGT
jgi:uncharacterized membrane protein YdbT with pleckstrin-like domain